MSSFRTRGPSRRTILQPKPIAFAAWLGVHALLMSGMRERIEAFIDWAWSYFSRSLPAQVLDRSDAKRIDWHEDLEGEDTGLSPTAKTAR